MQAYFRTAVFFSVGLAGNNYFSGKKRVPQELQRTLINVSLMKGIVLGLTWPILAYHLIYLDAFNCVYGRKIEYNLYGVRYRVKF